MIITKEEVNKIFEEAESQEDYIVAFYRLAIPGWNHVKKVRGYPQGGHALVHYVADQAIEFDNRVHNKPLPPHKHIMPGGLWLNYGYKRDENLGDWEVSINGVGIIYEDKAGRTSNRQGTDDLGASGETGDPQEVEVGNRTE